MRKNFLRSDIHPHLLLFESDGRGSFISGSSFTELLRETWLLIYTIAAIYKNSY